MAAQNHANFCARNHRQAWRDLSLSAGYVS
ncbi:MAG: DUF3649 domain-containing protein [Rhodobacteraceae bacterium]|nr:DUF3649 domain-containing protein [Paracoccaceae bacterium]